MVIMFVAPGRSIHSNNWASAMCDKGHIVHFVTQESFINNQYSFLEKVDDRFIIHQLPYRGKKGFLLNGLEIKKLTKEINPDIIHVHQAAGYGLLGTFTKKERAIVSVYGWEVYDLVKSCFWKPIIKHILHWYKYIGSTSNCMKNQILKVFPTLKAPIYVTPFGIDMSVFHAAPMEKDELIIGTVKKMDKKYGITYLIQAFAKTYLNVKRSNPKLALKLYLELVGPGDQTGELKEIAKSLGISDRVRFLGKVPHKDVPKWLNRFDIYAAPSILDSESFGVAVIEASACRRPVVVSNVGGLPEVVIDGITGFVVPARESDILSQKLTQLILNEKLRMQMGEAGEQLVREKYEWGYCVELMETIYKSILKSTDD